jgi:hypothetical protein
MGAVERQDIDARINEGVGPFKQIFRDANPSAAKETAILILGR